MAPLTAKAFELLLERLDADQSVAGEKYELLHLKLMKCLYRRGCPDVDVESLADETLDRVAGKIDQGTEIIEIEAFACRVLRLVWLEYLRKHGKVDRPGDLPEVPVEPVLPEDPDIRLACLRSCLVEVTPNDKDRTIILEYYNTDIIQKLNQQRKALALRLGLEPNTLKQNAFRLRARLEKCINECVRKHPSTVTN